MLVNDTHNIVQDNIDLSKCLARKSSNLHQQCKNKKKDSNDFCGIHLKCSNVHRIDQPLSIISTKKKKFRILKNPKILSYQYLEKTDFKESKIRISDIKYTLKYYNLPIKKSKHENLNSLIFQLRNLNYYNGFLKQILLIQKLYRKNKINRINKLRGPSLFNRKNINNEYDFLTCENMIDIPNDKFFSYKDSDGFIYGFNIESIKYLIDHQDKNPYNRNPFPNKVIEKFKILVKIEEKMGKDLNFKFDDPISKYQKMKQKCVKIFQRFDYLEHYSQVDWFLNIPLNKLKKLYAEIEDIWNYRAMLSTNMQKKYVKDGKAFQHSISSINKISDILKLQNILLKEFYKFAFEGQTKEDCITSTYWILTGLTLVSPEAAEGLPYLVQSNAFN
jgi:hypothetical protein